MYLFIFNRQNFEKIRTVELECKQPKIRDTLFWQKGKTCFSSIVCEKRNEIYCVDNKLHQINILSTIDGKLIKKINIIHPKLKLTTFQLTQSQQESMYIDGFTSPIVKNDNLKIIKGEQIDGTINNIGNRYYKIFLSENSEKLYVYDSYEMSCEHRAHYCAMNLLVFSAITCDFLSTLNLKLIPSNNLNSESMINPITSYKDITFYNNCIFAAYSYKSEINVFDTNNGTFIHKIILRGNILVNNMVIYDKILYILSTYGGYTYDLDGKCISQWVSHNFTHREEKVNTIFGVIDEKIYYENNNKYLCFYI